MPTRFCPGRKNGQNTNTMKYINIKIEKNQMYETTKKKKKMVEPGTEKYQQEKGGKKFKRKDCGKMEETGGSSSISLYEIELMP
jgi:hypothetical protein